MSNRRPLSILYAAPGQNLLSSAGPTRNVLSVANALSKWADVTVAFRHILEPLAATPYRVIAIEPSMMSAQSYTDDTATRGLHPFRHLSYCRTLRRFARDNRSRFDAVLEKGWRLSGFLSTAFQDLGVPAALVENAVTRWTDRLSGFDGFGKYVLHRSAQAMTNVCSRRLSVIIAETEELKAMLVAHRGIAPERIAVVELGVDHQLFRPSDQQHARELLQIDPEAVVILYVGGIDEYHDLEPAIGALAVAGPASTELHVVGNGEYRVRAEAQAKSVRIKSRFHGRVTHDSVPRYIAAADLCIAPYRTGAFHDDTVTFATLKIPEYMACGRPVASVPSPAISRLITHAVNGFLFPNDMTSWVSFLRTFPSRPQLATMGDAAATAVRSIDWHRTARRYFEICEQLSAQRSWRAESR